VDNFEPRRGALAFCSRNELGLIISDTPIEVTYKACPGCLGELTDYSDWDCQCEKGTAWAGIHLSAEKLGQRWSSRNPRVVGEIHIAPYETQPYFVVDGRGESRAHLHP
jgi:hypothetical protein